MPYACKKLPSWLLAACLLVASLWLLPAQAGAQQNNVPGIPTEFAASRGNTHRQVFLAWHPPTNNGGSAIIQYVIDYSDDDEFPPNGTKTKTLDVDGASGRTTHRIGSLTRGTRYYFRVAAVNANGQGDWSETADAMPLPVITVVAVNDTVTEGANAEFRVNLRPVPSTETPVTVEITVEGNYGVNGGNEPITVDAGKRNQTLILATADDTTVEADGLIIARVSRAGDYAVGNPRTAKILIENDDENEPPVFSEGESATRSLPENSGPDVNVGNPITATDQNENTLTYTLSGADAGSFNINSSTGQLTTKTGATYDFETKPTYTVTVEVSDGTDSDSITVNIILTDVNEVPKFTVRFTIPENQTTVGNIAASDEDSADTVTSYTLEGTDRDLFTLADDGTLSIKNALDFENPQGGANDDSNTYELFVTVESGTDSRLMTATQNLTITVSDENEPPAFTSGATFSVAENSTAVATVTATDQDSADNVTLAITAGADKDLFNITTTGGVLTFLAAPDFENSQGGANDDSNSYVLTVKATSGADTRSLSATQNITITVTDVDEKPVFTDGDTTTREVPENSDADVDVGDPIAATDPEQGTLTYTLTGTDAASFDIDPATGQLSTKTGVTYDFETTPAYTLTVTATDDGSPALSATTTVTVNVTDVPTFYRQKRTWTGRNENNTADVTLTTYGTWSTSSTPPQDAPDITSTESIDPENEAGQVRKRITWTDEDGNYAYQFTKWYAPTRTEYREVKHWSDDLGKTVGPWSANSNPSGAPNVGNVNLADYRDNAGAGGTWTWEERAAITWSNPQTGASTIIYGPWVDRGGSHPDNDPPAPPGSSGSTPSHEPSFTRGEPESRPAAPADYKYVPADGPSENLADIDDEEFVPTGYRKVRTWTGRNADNTADVTLITYGTWSTDSNPPEDAPAITASEPTIETRDGDEMVRKKITWPDNNGNYTYQFTEWYNTNEYRERKNWSDDLGRTHGPWSTNPNPSGAPNVGNRNGAEYRDNGGAGGTWTWEERAAITWSNPQTGASTTIYGPWVDRGGSHPDNDPPAQPGSSGSTPSHEPSSTRQVEKRPVAEPADLEYTPANDPSEDPVRTGVRRSQDLP